MFNPNMHLMDLKGKSYLQVMWRLVWFREDVPDYCIDTKLESLTDTHAVFSAKIYDENGVQKASGYGSESVKDFKDFIEKAETKAVGRALAMFGYGTQFAPELDEGERIADSPVDKKPAEIKFVCADCGEVITPWIKDGKTKMSVREIAQNSEKEYRRRLCLGCIKKLQAIATLEANEN